MEQKRDTLQCNSLVRHPLEYAVQFGSPRHAQAFAKLGVYRRATKISSWRNNTFQRNSLVRHHLEYAVQFWSGRHAQAFAELEGDVGQQRPLSFRRNKPYDERLSFHFILSCEKLHERKTEYCKIVDGLTNMDTSELFTVDDTLRRKILAQNSSVKR